LSPRDLSFVTRDGIRQLTPGQYRLSVGSGQPGTGVAQQDGTLTLKQTVVLAR
jgi:beta-glucosidase